MRVKELEQKEDNNKIIIKNYKNHKSNQILPLYTGKRGGYNRFKEIRQ
jgi:hypothetical protein